VALPKRIRLSLSGARTIEVRYQLHRFGSRVRRRQPIEREAFTIRLLYPEAAGGGLSRLLRVELDRIGSGIEVSWPLNEGAMYSTASRGQRDVSIVSALDERAFHVVLSAEGVEYFGGWAAELAEVAAAIDRWLHEEVPGAEEMAARFPFLDFDEFAQAYERGDAIEEAWRGLLETGGPAFAGMRPLIEAAAREPRLRQLRPFTSMDRLCFSRWVGFPFSGDLPHAAPHQGRFLVWKPPPDEYPSERPEDLLGEGDALRAVELLLAALPEPLEVLYRQPASMPEQTGC
jgi:hypothetical protein